MIEPELTTFGTYIGASTYYFQDIRYEFDSVGNYTGEYEVITDTFPPSMDTILVSEGESNTFHLSSTDINHIDLSFICDNLYGTNSCVSSNGSSGLLTTNRVVFNVEGNYLEIENGWSDSNGPVMEYGFTVFRGYK